MSAVIGILILVFVLPYLASRISQARNAAWTGPRTTGMRGRAVKAPAARSRGKAAAKAAKSAGNVIAHPGSRQIRAQAKADAFTAWQQAFATNYLEDRRHARANGTAPATGTATDCGTGTATAARPTIRQRLRLAPFTSQPAGTGSGQDGTRIPAPNGNRTVKGNGGPPARRVPPPPASPPAPPSGTNGGTNMAAGTSTASAEKLIEGINEIHAHAAAGGINAKREAIKAAHEGLIRFAAMLAMLSRQMSEPGQNYGHEITEPLAQAGTHCQAGSMSVSESDAALSTLINMTVGDLANSPRRAPHHEELSETGAR